MSWSGLSDIDIFIEILVELVKAVDALNVQGLWFYGLFFGLFEVSFYSFSGGGRGNKTNLWEL